MENISQEIPRTDWAKECIFRASRGSTFLKIYCVSTILSGVIVGSMYVPIFSAEKDSGYTTIFIYFAWYSIQPDIFLLRTKGWQNVFADNSCYIKTLIVIPDWFFVFSWWAKEHPQKTFKYWSCRDAKFQRPWSLHCLCPSIIL